MKPALALAVLVVCTGAYGQAVSEGRAIMQNTPARLPGNVRAGLSCQACHLEAGTKPFAFSLAGSYAAFPQWDARSKRVISIQDRVAECFLYSMNGTPPAYTSRAMEALTAYIAWLSRGVPVGRRLANQAPPRFDPPAAAHAPAGARIYAQRCAACHGTGGDGAGAMIPPLWGPRSFNDGAGMHRLETMARFVRYAMPLGSAPNTLSAQEAYDVSAFVLSHPRPHFNPRRMVGFPAQQSGFF